MALAAGFAYAQFQPFLRFYPETIDRITMRGVKVVSTLLEILQAFPDALGSVSGCAEVFQPFLRFWIRSSAWWSAAAAFLPMFQPFLRFWAEEV